MQIQDAIQLIQQKFMAEVQDQLEHEVHDKYAEAFDNYPLVMEVAQAAFADEIIQKNYEARKAMADQAKAAEGSKPEAQA